LNDNWRPISSASTAGESGVIGIAVTGCGSFTVGASVSESDGAAPDTADPGAATDERAAPAKPALGGIAPVDTPGGTSANDVATAGPCVIPDIDPKS
jgi:hypothetical protein